MKRPPKTIADQFTLSLYREPTQQFDGETKAKLLNVLADLLREVLGEKTKATEKLEKQNNES